DEDDAAMGQDRAFGIIQHLPVTGLQRVAAFQDPGLIQRAPGGGMLGAVRDNGWATHAALHAASPSSRSSRNQKGRPGLPDRPSDSLWNVEAYASSSPSIA